MRAGASGMTSIELLLDSAAEGRVRVEWEALAAAGMSSLARHDAPSNRPHVTLLARSTPVAHPLGIDAAALPLPLVVGPPVLLGEGDRRVLARVVVASAALLALHAEVLLSAGPGDDPAHLLPGRWLPHVTLARRIRLADVPAALELLGPPIDAQGVAVRRWDAATATVSHAAGADATR
ncbi:2'-5' RNA ligase family protein [Agrococcus sp. DT81.2]|uniref:2'-5' RNA ligase family protein n=1 Tax=Agrococcus sp. DT81.2 TaxID=3393414 RepID=UPI003CE505B4